MKHGDRFTVEGQEYKVDSIFAEGSGLRIYLKPAPPDFYVNAPGDLPKVGDVYTAPSGALYLYGDYAPFRTLLGHIRGSVGGNFLLVRNGNKW